MMTKAPRWAALLLVLVVAWGCVAPRVQASTTPGARSHAPALFAGFKEYILGNRSRMVQVAFVAFGIGIAILVTATRKH